jgi:transglutaminase-like putative cysteine protease
MIFSLFTDSIVIAENYLLNGGQESTIQYKLIQQVEPTSETVTVDLTFVIVKSYQSPTYNQKINDFNITFSQQPTRSDQLLDNHGNEIMKYSWEKPKKQFKAEISFSAQNSVSLQSITTNSPYPLKEIPPDVKKYLVATEQVQSENPLIKEKSLELIKKAKTQFDAVQTILSWIIDHMYYVLTPEQYDAIYTFNHGKGNCQNYSHLAAALLRAIGIPVRIVNGITLKQPYDIKIDNQILTLNMAEGRHSWIEVYFPDLGWMPFDPQQTELFVSNRFIRVEVGLDNNDTKNDGLVHWTRTKGSKENLSFQESIEADFMKDTIHLNADRKKYGPKKLLLQPVVNTSFIPVISEKIQPPVPTELQIIQKLKFNKPFIYGNLDFPEGVNFAFIRESIESKDGITQSLQKNFLVETAEYVTSNLQYCQVFLLSKPIKLDKIGLALHKFGGIGQLWIELREDSEGVPGKVAAVSKKVDLNQLLLKPGYYWTDFDFSSQNLLLSPDRYWISLAFSGSPIVNWFYSYGKPVGPIDGTRYKSLTEDNWTRTLSYEFVYRVTGLTAE